MKKCNRKLWGVLGLLLALGFGIGAEWGGWALASPEEPIILAPPAGEIKVLGVIPPPPEIWAVKRPEPDATKIPPEIDIRDVAAAFKALKGGEKALEILQKLGIREAIGSVESPILASLQVPIVPPIPVVPLQATMLLTPLRPVASGPAPFTMAYLDLWNMDAFATYKDLPRMCALDKAYFLDHTLGWGAPSSPLAAQGRVNGWFNLGAPGWYLFVAKFVGQPRICVNAYVNNVWVGNFTISGVGIAPILVQLPAGWCWVRFDQVQCPLAPPWPSMGALISLKAWKL